jgi:hypothetical protein
MLFYKLYQNNNSYSEPFGKWFRRTVMTEKVAIDVIAQRRGRQEGLDGVRERQAREGAVPARDRAATTFCKSSLLLPFDIKEMKFF